MEENSSLTRGQITRGLRAFITASGLWGAWALRYSRDRIRFPLLRDKSNIYTSAERRARATLAPGKSGNPLAIEQIIQALADASPRVRRSAAHALSETGSELGLPSP